MREVKDGWEGIRDEENEKEIIKLSYLIRLHVKGKPAMFISNPYKIKAHHLVKFLLKHEIALGRKERRRRFVQHLSCRSLPDLLESKNV